MSTLREIIASGVQLTKDQDDEAYALLPPEEYYAIPEHQKPSHDQHITPAITFNVQSLENLQNDWCVYLVNSVFLGCCKLSQVLMIPDVARTYVFKGSVHSNTAINIQILSQFDDASDARDYLNNLVETGLYIKPHSSSVEPPKKPYKIRCSSDGNNFTGVIEAARFYGISRQSIYNSLNGTRQAPRNLLFERL